jgi:hypothetical protein
MTTPQFVGLNLVPKQIQRSGQVTTVDQSDIRGLVSAKTWLRRGAASDFLREFGLHLIPEGERGFS